MSENEINFLLIKLRSIFDPEQVNDDEEEIKLSFGKILKAGLKILWSIICGKIGIRSVGRLLKAFSRSGKIKKHYKKFPENPNDFEKWRMKAEEIWNQRTRATKLFQSTSAVYP
ncbi:MAG: hypothetical protein ACTSRB_11440 [Candidatus Helarchaeota archaeon]